MGLLKLRRLLVLRILGLLIGVTTAAGGSGNCGFPAVYNFGDSNSDTGGISAAFNAIQPPNGETFFRRPSGRACDGRLIVDFIAEKLKLPFLSAYLDSLGTNFRHGANFATGGSSICPGGYSPFHLGIQVSQFIQFKSRITDLFNRLHSNRTMNLHDGMILFTLSINSPGFALSFPKRPRTSGDVFLTYKLIDHSLKPMEPSNNLPFIEARLLLWSL